MKPADLFLYLIGNRGAIERVAATRGAWLIGAILVLSAGIARNYDHLDLLREPEWFIGPFAASLVSVGFIYLWLSGPLKFHAVGSYWRQWGVFLSLAWLTAPCAWLYGIPVESMSDIMTATKWNIAFLAIVALWRVAIIVRAVSVLADVSWRRVLPLVLAPAALEAFVGSTFERLSLVGIMGGIRLEPHTTLLVDATRFTTTASFFIFVGSVIAHFFTKARAAKPLFRPAAGAARKLYALALGALTLWMLAALPMRPLQANRHHLAQLLQDNKFAEAIAFASAKKRGDFPPHHHLPPSPSPWFNPQVLVDLPAEVPAWLREEWVQNAIESRKAGMFHGEDVWKLAYTRYPEIPAAVTRYASELRARPEELDRDERRWLSIYESRQAEATASP